MTPSGAGESDPEYVDRNEAILAYREAIAGRDSAQSVKLKEAFAQAAEKVRPLWAAYSGCDDVNERATEDEEFRPE